MLFWDITQRKLVVPYRRFDTTFPSHLLGSSSRRRVLGCPETPARKYQSTLCRIPKQRASYFAQVPYSDIQFATVSAIRGIYGT